MPGAYKRPPLSAGAAPVTAAMPTDSTGRNFVALHRSRSFEWRPATVTALSPCPAGNLLAVGYETGDVELWDMQLLVCLQRIPACAVGTEITSCAWIEDPEDKSWRLFLSLMNGTLVEVSWRLGVLQTPTDGFGGTVWCLASKPRSTGDEGTLAVMAAACDDGGLRLFEVEAGSTNASLRRVVARVDGRLLAVAWSPFGDTLYAAGTAGIIHVMPVSSGNAAQRITVSSTTTRQVVVWCLLVLPDGTLVSGDSDGAVQFWDASFGTLLQRFQQHAADVLALAASAIGSSVFAAGVDSQVVQFRHAAPSEGSTAAAQWAYTHYKRPHLHDVRALAITTGHRNVPVLVSAGVDGSLLAYPVNTFLQEHPVRLSRCPQRPTCQLARQHPGSVAAAPEAARLLVAQGETLDMLQLARSAEPPSTGGPASSSSTHTAQEGDPLTLLSAARHVARIKISGSGRVRSVAVSPNGTLVAVACGQSLRCYQLEERAASGLTAGAIGHAAAAGLPAAAGSQPQVAVARLNLPTVSKPALAIALTNELLVSAHSDGSLTAVSLRSEAGEAGNAPQTSLGHLGLSERSSELQSWRAYAPPIMQLVASPDGCYVAASGPNGVAVFQLPELIPTAKLLRPPDAAPVAAMAFSHGSALLAVVSGSGALRIYDVAAGGAMLLWSSSNCEAVDEVVAAMPGTPLGLSFNPAAEFRNQLVVYTASAMAHFNLSAPLGVAARPEGKRRRGLHPSRRGAAAGQGTNGRVVLWENPTVFIGHVAGDALLSLEKPWEEVLQGLPAPLHRHIYGT